VNRITQGFHHITMVSSNAPRTVRFYRDLLGFALVKRTVNIDDRVEGLDVLRTAGHRPDAPHRFPASSDEEQLAWRDHLLGFGIEVTPVQDRAYFQSIYFRAPDGQLLEIATDGPGFAVDEDSSRLGHALMLPTWLEQRRGQLEESLVPLP
jgi:glyoxalase family protein